jgi:hypothetical protein
MQTKLYVGLDLHSNNTYVGIIDSKERRVQKGKFPNQLEMILAVLDPRSGKKGKGKSKKIGVRHTAYQIFFTGVTPRSNSSYLDK